MIEKIWKSIQDASSVLAEQADQFGKGAKEKAFKLIEDWVSVFPRLQEAGLTITSFSMGVALSPSLEVEFVGKHEDFSYSRLELLMEQHRGSTALVSVFQTIKSTYRLHDRLETERKDPLIVKVYIRLSPEIKVFVGEPIIM